MFWPVDENGEDLSEARYAELEAEHRRAIEEGRDTTEPTELERATARAWAQATGCDYEQYLAREVQRRIRMVEHRRARAAPKAERPTTTTHASPRKPSSPEPRPAASPPSRLAGAHGRYEVRRIRWRAEPLGWLRHLGWWWLHNLVIHPLLGVLPVAAVVRLHDWSSGRLSRSLPSPSPLPRISSRWHWLVHNVGAHVAIGLWPCAATFRWHDATAKQMAVPGWV